MSLFAELKRRNVFRVGLFYIVSAWLIVQVAETLLPIFDVPDGVLRAIVLILVLGFVPALVFAWAFELTPDGLKRDKDANVDPATKQQTSQKLNWATLIAAVLAIGLLAADRMMPKPAVDTETASMTGRSAESFEARPELAGSASIAVLPFINMSPDADNAFFADGISEELLNILASIDGLAVASRTSAFSFRGDSTPIPEIAATLNVRYVLEGSVRKQGDRVRITSQLIDAQSDVHLWSDTYERRLDDIFRVQESIARSITSELTGLLLDESVQVDSPTDSLEAYEHFLRGRSMFYQRTTLDDAIASLQRAVELDSQFAQAWAFLGATQYVVGNGGYETEGDPLRLGQDARASADRALALNDSIPIALAIKGQMLIDQQQGPNISEGLRLMEVAAEASTADTTPRMWLGIQQLTLGDIERAFESFQQVREQDPLVPINNGYLGLTHAMLGRTEEGTYFTMRAVELNPSLFYWNHSIAVGAANGGDIERAIELTLRAREKLPESSLQYSVLSGYAEALEQGLSLDEWQAAYPLPPGPTAQLFRTLGALLLGDMDASLDFAGPDSWVDRTVVIYTGWLPSMQALREDPRFFELVDVLGILDYWMTVGFPLGCAPIDDGGVQRLECGDAA